MQYDVFIMDGSVFEPDTSFVHLCGLSQTELSALERIMRRQTGFDVVIRPVQGESEGQLGKG